MATPATPSLAALLGDRAASEPDAAAVVVDGGETLTYGDWHRRSDAAAGGLRSERVRSGDRVLLRFDREHWTDYAVAYAGVAKAGAVAVPVPEERSRVEATRIAAHCGVRAVITVEALGRGGAIAGVAWAGPVGALEHGGDDGHPGAPSPHRGPVEISYRSGPLRRLQATEHFSPDIVAVMAPGDAGAPSLAHSFSIGSDVARAGLWFPIMAGGGPMILLVAFDADRLCSLTEERQVTHWGLHPRLLPVVLGCQGRRRHDLSSLRRLLLSGGGLPPTLLSQLAAELPQTGVVHLDGESAGAAAVPPPPGPRRGAGVTGTPAAAGSEAEEVTAAVLERVTGRRPAAVDELSSLGMGTGGAVEVLDLLEDAFGARIDPSELLAAPTVAALAAAVEARSEVPGDAGVAPVAFSQEGMLWQEHLVPGSQNLPPLVRRYRGPLDVAALERALEAIVGRHEPLRSTFELRHGRPVQVVAHSRPVPSSAEDLSRLPPAEQEAELARRLSAAARPFDLVTGPLFEAHLFRLAAEDHVVMLRVHHSVYDDWSVGVFRRELSALYTAFSRGAEPPLADLPLGFADFARGQRRRLAGPAGTAELAWWKDHLAGAPLCLQLPIDDPERSEGVPSASAAPVSLELDTDLARRLRALATQERSTLFMTVLAGFQVLLHRCTGLPELLLASVVANRNRTELEGMIGCFTKKILLRLDAAGDPSFTELLRRVRAGVLGGLMHQDLPFETVLQQALGRPAAGHGLVPHVAVMFQGVTPQPEEVTLPGVATSGYDTSATTTRAHFAAGARREEDDAVPWGAGLYNGTFLILTLVEGSDTLALSARGAFHEPSVERLLGDFRALLADIVADPSRPVSRLDVPPADHQPGPPHWSATPVDNGPAVATAGGRFEARARKAPEGAAITGGGRSLTAAELAAAAAALADRLRVLGVGPGTLVGICLPASVQSVVAVLAVWKTGGAYVGLDPEDSDEGLAAVAGDAALDIVVTGDGARPSALATVCRLVDVDDPASDPMVTAVQGGSTPGDPGTDGLDGVATVFYGSGSSSVRPPVVVNHGAVLGLVGGLVPGVYGAVEGGAGRRVWLSATPAGDPFLRHLAALLAGHALRVPSAGRGAAGAELVELMGAGEVDVADLERAEAAASAGAGLGPALAGRRRRSPTPVLVVGGRTPVDRDLRRSLAALAGVRVVLLFGPPACSFGAAALPLEEAGARPTVGRPLAGVTTAVLDEEGRPAPVRVTGEIHVGGATLAQPDSRHRSYRTGHLGRFLPDGTIEVVGAVADTLVWRGHRLDRSRMERALRRCRAVREVAISQRRSESGESVLFAGLVQEAPGEGPTLAELRRALWEELPGYAWPAEIEVDGLRLAPTVGSGLPYEGFLAGLWGDVLGAEPVEDNQLYWHRFSFLEVVDRAREAGVRIGPAQVTRHRTVATLATDLAGGQAGHRKWG